MSADNPIPPAARRFSGFRVVSRDNGKVWSSHRTQANARKARDKLLRRGITDVRVIIVGDYRF